MDHKKELLWSLLGKATRVKGWFANAFYRGCLGCIVSDFMHLTAGL